MTLVRVFADRVEQIRSDFAPRFSTATEAGRVPAALPAADWRDAGPTVSFA
jgi:hypothetical protein